MPGILFYGYDIAMTVPCLVCLQPVQQQIAELQQYRILKCNVCDLRFLDPLPSTECLEKFYASHENYNHYAKVAERKLKSGATKIKRLLKYTKGRSFLDIGCSTGANVEAARRLGFKASGIDLCRQSIEFAKANYPSCDFKIGDMTVLNDKFDLVFCTEVLEHVTKPHEFIASIASVMNTGAVLYMTTPDAGHWRVPRDFKTWKHVHAPDHLAYYQLSTVKRLLSEHGLKILKTQWTTRTNIQFIARKLTSS